MDAGDLRTRITLESPADVANDTGGWTSGWGSPVQVWARVRALQGSEALLVGALQGQVLWELTIRHRPGISPQMRATLPDGRVLEITAVVPLDDRGAFLRLLARQERVGSTT